MSSDLRASSPGLVLVSVVWLALRSVLFHESVIDREWQFE